MRILIWCVSKFWNKMIGVWTFYFSINHQSAKNTSIKWYKRRIKNVLLSFFIAFIKNLICCPSYLLTFTMCIQRELRRRRERKNEKEVIKICVLCENERFWVKDKEKRSNIKRQLRVHTLSICVWWPLSYPLICSHNDSNNSSHNQEWE